MFTALQIGVITFMVTVVATSAFFIVGALIGFGSVLAQFLRAMRRPAAEPVAAPMPKPVEALRMPHRAAVERATAAAPRHESTVAA